MKIIWLIIKSFTSTNIKSNERYANNYEKKIKIEEENKEKPEDQHEKNGRRVSSCPYPCCC